MKHPRVLIKLDGERVSVAEASRRIGISQMGLWNRLRRGVSRDELLKPGYGPRNVQHVIERHGGSFLAAANGALTADEYLEANGT